MNVDDAVASLMDDPQEFLRRNALQIAGGATLASGDRIFYLQRLDKTLEYSSSGPGWTHTGKLPFWRAVVTSDTAQRFLRNYKLGDISVAEFRAFYVGMKQIDDGAQTTHFALPGNQGPPLMLTSQLTGCTFGYGTQAVPGAGCLASHIQPAGSGDGKRAPGALSELGKRAVRMAVSAPLGPGAVLLESSSTTQITVVGTRVGGTWSFIKQIIDPMHNRVTTQNAVF